MASLPGPVSPEPLWSRLIFISIEFVVKVK